MDTIFMNSGNNKTSDSHRQLLNLADKTNLKTERSDKYVALSSLSICYIWKNIKKHKNNRLDELAPIWNEEFEIPMDDIIYQIFKTIILTFNKNIRK